MSTREKEVILRMLSMYRDMSYMWNYHHKDYRNRRKQEQGSQALLKVYRELEPQANIRSLSKKISNIRTTYSKELKKVLASKEMSSNPADWHSPTLWYYDHMTFLEDIILSKLERVPPPSALDQRESTTNGGLHHKTSDNEGSDDDPLSTTHSQRGQSESDNEMDLELFAPVKVEMSTPKPRATTSTSSSSYPHNIRVITEALAVQMQGLDSLQMTIAQKLMFDVLFYAKLGRLTEDSYIGNQVNTQNNTL